ncbi:A/G-specific adenine glycosylase [Candidatus Caldatribacterium sp. SIUC1]|uniref:A/G-specific adenine glycosylase n=1 Tax=Candidatus Caldatribacterium sp. SIUC1 TaxID=3418365 RepID=UPI003F68F288
MSPGEDPGLMPPEEFLECLFQWFAHNRRDLPWRVEYSPYRVLVAEVMLAQTQVPRVIPYYCRFLERFPDVSTLASALREEVLLAWEGLGYYRRAHHLHEAAQRIVERFQGCIPADFETLRRLPGIGPYIASAILGIGYNLPVLAIDTNVRRVLSRVFGAGEDVNLREIGNLLISHMPSGKARHLNEALMDFGALVCLSQKPRCSLCPFRGFCTFVKDAGRESRIRQQRTLLEICVAVCCAGEEVLLTRSEGKLFPGLWGLPFREQDGEDPRAWIDALGERYGFLPLGFQECGVVAHAYTRYRVRARVLRVSGKRTGMLSEAAWVAFRELPRYPLPSLFRKALALVRPGEYRP